MPPGLDGAPIAEQARSTARQGNANVAGRPIRSGDGDLRDRAKDVIISGGGENVASIEAEQAPRTRP